MQKTQTTPASLGGARETLQQEGTIMISKFSRKKGPRKVQMPIRKVVEQQDELLNQMNARTHVPKKVYGESQKTAFVLKVEPQKSQGRGRAISDIEAQSPSIRSADSCDKKSCRSGVATPHDMLSQKQIMKKKTKTNLSLSATKAQEAKNLISTPYPHKYKTSMCKNWVETGKCKFGDGCSFAHGNQELNSKDHIDEKSVILQKCDTTKLSTVEIELEHISKTEEKKKRQPDSECCGSSTMSTENKESCSRANSEFDERNEILTCKYEDSSNVTSEDIADRQGLPSSQNNVTFVEQQEKTAEELEPPTPLVKTPEMKISYYSKLLEIRRATSQVSAQKQNIDSHTIQEDIQNENSFACLMHDQNQLQNQDSPLNLQRKQSSELPEQQLAVKSILSQVSQEFTTVEKKEVKSVHIDSLFETRRLNVFAHISESESDDEEPEIGSAFTSIFSAKNRSQVGPIFTPSYDMKSRVAKEQTFPEFPDYKNLGMNQGSSTTDKNSLRNGKNECSDSEINQVTMGARQNKTFKKRKHYKMVESNVQM